MGLLMAAVLPGRMFGHQGMAVRLAARDIVAGLERTRSLSLQTGQEAVFGLDLDRRRFEVPGDRAPTSLPEGVTLALRTVRGEAASQAVGGIRFFPQGGSTGGGVVLSGAGQVYRISVSWLTGAVELRDGE